MYFCAIFYIDALLDKLFIIYVYIYIYIRINYIYILIYETMLRYLTYENY